MNRKITGAALAAPLVVLAILLSSASAFADPDLIGHWTLDDGLGNAAADLAGGNTGQLVGGPVWRPVGRIGGALAFDGVDDLVDLGSPDFGTPPADLSDQLTIGLWMRADDFGTPDARLVSRATGVAEQEHLWMVGTDNRTGLRFRLMTDGVTTTLVSATGLLEANQWYHICAVYDGLKMRLYRDGVEVAATAKFGFIDTNSAVGVALGNQPPGAGVRPFDGQLDDVRLYRRALTPTEVGSLAFPDGNQQPLADFTATPPVGLPPLTVAFDASASYDVDGSVVSYGWDFGDGSGGTGVGINHTYVDLGEYLTVLVVTDNEGATTTDSLLITVSDNPLITIPFTHEIVDAAAPALAHCKAAGDVDGDGLQDVLVAGAHEGEGFFWYHNPGWEKYTIVPAGVSGFTTDMTMGDVDGDGDLDAIIPKGYDYGDATFWYENPRPTGDPTAGPWTEHAIGVAGAHDVEAGDIDGNGLLDVVVRWQQTTLFLQTAADTWLPLTLNTQGDEGLDLVDLDLDGDTDVVLDGRWLENPLPGGDPGLVPWVGHLIDANWPNAVRVHAADIDSDGRPDVVFAASESTGERLSWYGAQDPVNGPWTEHLVAAQMDYVHSLEAADVDLDGDLDIVSAEMHQSADPDQVVVHRNEGQGRAWSPQLVATTGSHNMVVTDLDADGDIDLMGANHAQQPLEIWRNELNPGSQLSLNQWERFVADVAMPWQALIVEPAQVDDDDFPDVVAGGWWYRNPGSAGGIWVRSDLGLPLRNTVAVHDFDKDGDLDVLGTQGESYQDNGDFSWARNDGFGGFTVFGNIPSVVGEFVQGATVAALQSGGPLEVVFGWQGGTDTQVLNVPADPANEAWSWRVISDTTLGESIDYGDIDRDGDLDLLLGTKWLRNDGETWTAFDLFPLSPEGESDRVFLIDLNRDGRLDALVAYGHNRAYGSVSWYEQPLLATDMWTEHVIDHPFNPQSLDIADLDLDGDIDIVMGEHNRIDPATSELLIYENLDGFGAAWRQRLVHTGDEHHVGTRLFDIENDGDLDLVSIGYTHRRLMVYENLTSHRAPPPSPVDDSVRFPSRLVLSQNYPNPFNPSTRVRYELPTAARVSLAVYDIRGRLVSRLVDEEQPAGRHEVLFAPRGLASGVYLAHLQAGGQVRTVRMLLLK